METWNRPTAIKGRREAETDQKKMKGSKNPEEGPVDRDPSYLC